MKLSAIVVACLLALAACRNAPANGAGQGDSSTGPGYAGPAPIVTGMVLDARTGKPIAGALVRGPGGVETKSDAGGHFILDEAAASALSAREPRPAS